MMANISDAVLISQISMESIPLAGVFYQSEFLLIVIFVPTKSELILFVKAVQDIIAHVQNMIVKQHSTRYSNYILQI